MSRKSRRSNTPLARLFRRLQWAYQESERSGIPVDELLDRQREQNQLAQLQRQQRRDHQRGRRKTRSAQGGAQDRDAARVKEDVEWVVHQNPSQPTPRRVIHAPRTRSQSIKSKTPKMRMRTPVAIWMGRR